MSKNKLSIYLIKSEIVDEIDIIKDYEDKVPVSNNGVFYTEQSVPVPPDWVTNFFGDTLSQKVNYLLQSGAKGVFITFINRRSKKIYFAISFGTGRHMIKESAIEERFGLIVTLNSVYPESIRSISKSSLTANAKNSKEQISKPSSTQEFGIDIEQDLLKAVTGQSKHVQLGKTISGADVLSLTVPNDVHNITSLLSFCHNKYTSKDYLKEFEWVDQLKAIKNKETLNHLNEKLIKLLNEKKFNNIWAAVPDIIDWEDLDGFRYSSNHEELVDVIELAEVVESYNTDITYNNLKSKTIYAKSASSGINIKTWSFYKCLYGEITHYSRQYILNGGKWYEVSTDFVSKINEFYESIELSNIQLPDFTHNSEGEYNLDVCNQNPNFLCMDKQNVMIGGGSNRIEFCDLFSKQQVLVHVKPFGSSSVLSHLFQQARNSAEVFLGERQFRENLNDKLSVGWKLENPAIRPISSNYEIVFAIIGQGVNGRPRIPFFSMITLKNAYKGMENMGFNVTIKQINSN